MTTDRLLLLGIALAGVPAHRLAAQSPDTTTLRALDDYRNACAEDGGRLWGTSLCGPMVLVHAGTRQAVASDSPPSAGFRQGGTVYTGRLPDEILVANTAVTWGGRRWAMVLLPLPRSRPAALALLLHESFHRIEDTLRLGGTDAASPHLDSRDGRYWLRLELRAYQAALRVRGEASLAALRHALLFRAMRHRAFPGADSLESALDIREGLPEYTGFRLAIDHLGGSDSVVADMLRRFEARPSYVRAVAYATGPARGFLLDRFAEGWRGRVRDEGVAPQLARAVAFQPPADLPGQARRDAARYDGEALAAEEDARETARVAELAGYRSRLVEGRVLDLRQDWLNTAFDPNQVVVLEGVGTVYPSGTFKAAWGQLVVTDGGALVSPDFRRLRVAAPAAPPAGARIAGPGWVLELAEGWSMVPAGGGAFTVRRDP